jgi:hypothetical protein
MPQFTVSDNQQSTQVVVSAVIEPITKLPRHIGMEITTQVREIHRNAAFFLVKRQACIFNYRNSMIVALLAHYGLS